MYLSKIVFSWPACRNPYEWHRSIWKLFPEKSKDDDRDFLFTCLDRRSGRNVSAILLSKGEPKYRSGEEIELVGESKSLADLCFKSGQVLRFKLIANPTKVLTEQNAEKRKIRVPLIKEEQQVLWLKRKLDGIAVLESIVTQNETPLYFNRKGKGGKIVPVNFEGILKVIDSEKFKEIYLSGIGPAKAFGCGLMLVRRA